MADPTARELKLIQYLNEAYGKEKELETALKAHIPMTTRPPYKKRLQDHLKETRAQEKNLERRIKQLGGKADQGVVAEAADTVASVAKKSVSFAKGPMHALRGTGENEKMLKNAKTEYFNEHEEIATYTGIEALAEALDDPETAKLAREHRRQEERMAKFLEKQIPQLTKAVVTEEIPANERRPVGAAPARRSNASRSTNARSSNGRSRNARSAASRPAAAARSRAQASS
jgi:ferritin-like metal-binding protein YciE